MAAFSGIPSPQFALRKVPNTGGPTLPSYAQLAAGEVKSVSSNTVFNVAPPNPFQGTNLGSIGGGNYWCQGQAILNPYYGQWGAMVAYGLMGHAAAYYGTEAYIAAFGQTGVSWVRVTNPCPFGGSGNIDPALFPISYYDDVRGEYKYPGAGGPDWFGHPWVGDHTRGHQVVVSGGTGNQGRLFHPKTGCAGGAAVYTNWPHIFDCGVETGTPSYDQTKQWTTRGTTVGPTAGGFGGGCWFEPDTNIVRFLSTDTTFVQTQLHSFDVSGQAPVALASRPFQTGTLGQSDGAVEYIASRKLGMSWYRVGGTRLFDMTVTSGTIPMTVMSQWAAPPASIFSGTSDWVGVAYSSRMVYCPVDGNFYVLDVNQVYSPGATRLIRFTPPVDFRSGISNSAAMATPGGGEVSRWVNLTPSLTGNTLAVSTGTPKLWGIYNGLCWHDKFSCFVVCTDTGNPIQLIKPPVAPTPG